MRRTISLQRSSQRRSLMARSRPPPHRPPTPPRGAAAVWPWPSRSPPGCGVSSLNGLAVLLGQRAEHVGAQLVARDLPGKGGFDGDAGGRTHPAAPQPLGDMRLCLADPPGQGGLPAGQGYGPQESFHGRRCTTLRLCLSRTRVINNCASIAVMTNLGERVKAERRAKGWSQAELARRVTRAGYSITQGGIAQIERRGDTEPKSIVQLAQALQVSVNWLQSVRGDKTAGVSADDEQLSMLPSGGRAGA